MNRSRLKRSRAGLAERFGTLGDHFKRRKTNIMKVLALRFVLVSAAILNAQEDETTPKFEIRLNYSWLRVNSTSGDPQRTGNGGSGYFEYDFSKNIGLVADIGANGLRWHPESAEGVDT
jgi:hypothetical protein